MKKTTKLFALAMAVIMLLTVVYGCASSPDAPDTAPQPSSPAAPAPAANGGGSAPPAATGGYKEAPMLSDLVSSGALPAVEDRVPQNPEVSG